MPCVQQRADVLLREYLLHFPFLNLRPVSDYLSQLISYGQGPPQRVNLYCSPIHFLEMPKQMTTNQVDQNKEIYSFSTLEAVTLPPPPAPLSCLESHAPSEDSREDFFFCLFQFLVPPGFPCLWKHNPNFCLHLHITIFPVCLYIPS